MQTQQIKLTGVNALVAAILGGAEGMDWPVSAQYMVSYRLKAWPCGYGEAIERFFDDEEELGEWLDEKAVWCSCDGNSMEFTIYEWNLGPQYKCSSFY